MLNLEAVSQQRQSRATFIGICGDQISGASTVTQYLLATPFPGRPGSSLREYIILLKENENGDNIAQIAECLGKLQKGEKCNFEGKELDSTGCLAVIVEGPSLLDHDLLAKTLDFKLYVDLADDLRCARYLDRMMRTETELFEILREYVEVQKKKYDSKQLEQKKRAGIILNVDMREDLTIDLKNTQSLQLICTELLRKVEGRPDSKVIN